MAREDFCFTYYDGDAARDKAHMTRLQRGAYDDIISAQRKRGHLSPDDIKRVLSKDFEECWPAMEWIMKKDEAGKYFIDWVDTSIEKSKENSARQRKRKKEWWDKRSDSTSNDTTVKPRYESGMPPVKPKEYGIGIEDENEIEEEIGKEDFGKSENLLPIITQMSDLWRKSFNKYTADKKSDYPALGEILNFMCRQSGSKDLGADSQIKILNTFQLIADQVNREPFWVNKPLRAIAPNIQEFYNKIKNPSNGTSSKQAGKNGSKTSLSKLQEIHSKRYGNGQ
jgi:hypothetical protein